MRVVYDDMDGRGERMFGGDWRKVLEMADAIAHAPREKKVRKRVRCLKCKSRKPYTLVEWMLGKPYCRQCLAAVQDCGPVGNA